MGFFANHSPLSPMKKVLCFLSVATVLELSPISSSASPGPVIDAPETVALNGSAFLGLRSSIGGMWTIAWGDGSPNTVVSSSSSGVQHVFSQYGIYEMTATFRNTSTNKSEDVQQDYAALVHKISPLLYYNFNDGTGTQNIGPGYLTVKGVTAGTDAASSNTGAPGGAVTFTGNGYLRMDDLAMKDANLFGLEFWLKPSNLTAKQMIFSGFGSANGNVQVYIEGGRLYFELLGSGAKSMDLGSDVQPGRWYHFAVSYERSPNFLHHNTVRFYRDGFVRAEESYTADQSKAVNFTGATIGAAGSGTVVSNYLQNAGLDEIIIHRLGVFPGGFLERDRAAKENFCKIKIAVGADGAEQSFTVDPPSYVGPINVALDPDPAAAAANKTLLNQLIDTAPPGSKLQIVNKNTGETGGTYYLGISSGFNGSYIILVKDKDDIEIDGGGSLLIISSPVRNYFELSGCTRVALRNMKFDVNQSVNRPSVYAMFQEVNDVTKRVVVHYVKGRNLEDDPIPTQVQHWRWRRVDPDTREQIGDGFFLADSSGLKKIPAESSGALWTFDGTGLKTDQWEKLKAAKDENALMQVNNVRFGGTAINLWNCKHMTFENIDIYGVMGMAFLSSTFDYMRISHVRIGLPPGLSAWDRPFAAAADGYHFHDATTGHLIFEDNEISMTDDDPISLKSPLKNSVPKTGDNTVTINSDTIKVGSVLEFRTTKLVPLNFTATVIKKEGDTITLDKNLPVTADGLYHVLLKFQPTEQWTIRNSRIYDLNGRMMIYTNNGTLENNRIEDMRTHIGISAVYYENAGDPYDIVVRGNYLVGGQSDTSVWGVDPGTGVINDIHFVKNSFYQNAFVGNQANRFVALGNYHERSPNKENSTEGGIHMAYWSKDTRAVGSTLYDPRAGSENVVTGTTSVTFALNEGHIVRHHLSGDGVEITVDNPAAVFTGSWATSTYWTGFFYGTNYRYSSTSTSTRYVTYTPTIPTTGKYQVYAMWNGGSDRGETVTYVVNHAGGSDPVVRSQRSNPGLWVYLGAFDFDAGTSGNVIVQSSGSNGIAIADAIRFCK